MKNHFKIYALLSLVILLHSVTTFADEEPWKGQTSGSSLEIGALSGLSLYGGDSAFSVLGTIAYLAIPKGFIDEIDNRVWIETEFGPAFFSRGIDSQTAFEYSAHLRWDFTYNQEWTYYALGGLGGYSLPKLDGGGFTIHPRVGLGVEYQTKATVMFRGEVSSEFMGLGVAFNF